MHNLLDIAHLKTLGTPHYFGLGFIQLKINETERLHFYHPEIMPILDEDEIHDHRYGFVSTVLLGALENEIYTYDRDHESDWGVFEVSCKKEDAGKEPKLISECNPYFLARFYVETANLYELSPTVFHKIRYSSRTVTHLKRGPIVKQFARVIKPLDQPAVCPFSKVMTQDEIWEIIEQIISG